MIIARITYPDGKRIFHGSVEITGSPAEEDYRMEGWFPVDDFNFGLEEAKMEEKPSPTDPKGQKTARQPAKTSSGKNGKPEENPKSKMDISKKVDRATPYLMVLAMEEKSKKEGANRGAEEKGLKELHADVHVLGSVAFGKDTKQRFVYPSLMVHLEGVRVTKWGIKGTEDSRCGESITLEYDKGAMQYTLTLDGKEFAPSSAVGWDQDLSKRWPDVNKPAFFERYLPKPKS